MARMPSAAKLLFMVFSLAVWPVLVLVLAGDWRWVAGWIFSLWFVSVCVTTVTWLLLKGPALLAEIVVLFLAAASALSGPAAHASGRAWTEQALRFGNLTVVLALFGLCAIVLRGVRTRCSQIRRAERRIDSGRPD